MASSRRATNNSTVTSLDDQSLVITQVLDEGGISIAPPDNLDKIKTVPKKKTKKASNAKSKAAGSPLDPPLDIGVTPPSRPDGNVTETRRAEPSATVTTATVNQQMSSGDVPSNGTSRDGIGANEPGHAAQTGQESLEEFFLRQQQWLWQQQQAAFPQFGNFVPNFALGSGFLPTSWEQGDQDEEEDTPLVRDHQPTHVVSDDEEPEPDVEVATVPTVAQGPVAVPEGRIKDRIEEQLGLVKEADRVSKDLEDEVAKILTKYLKEGQSQADMDKLAKKYPRPANVENMKTPRLDEELFQVVDPKVKASDQGLQAVQKALMGAMAALGPVLELTVKRGKGDQEIEELGENIMDSLQLLAHVSNSISGKRRELIRPQLAPVYAKMLTRAHNASPDWLYGGDLVESTKQCEVAKRIGDKIVKRKPLLPRNPQSGFKRFRGNSQFPSQQNMFRAFNPFQPQNTRFPAPQFFAPGFQQQWPMPMQWNMGFPRRQRFYRPQQQQQKQGFQKKGNYNK